MAKVNRRPPIEPVPLPFSRFEERVTRRSHFRRYTVNVPSLDFGLGRSQTLHQQTCRQGMKSLDRLWQHALRIFAGGDPGSRRSASGGKFIDIRQA
jgi:hypothetical protein